MSAEGVFRRNIPMSHMFWYAVVSSLVIICLRDISLAERFNGVEFPSGVSSFADTVLSFDPLYNGYLELDRFIASTLVGSDGFVALIDVDAYFPRFNPGMLHFVAVQIIDDPTRGSKSGSTAGMDLESVGAMSSLATVLGDVNLDGSLDVADLDTLSRGIQQGSDDPLLDLNRDGTVDDRDRNIWIQDLMDTYFGDADLNGEFNSADFVQVFVAGKYETGAYASWSEGDWDGGGFFDSRDFVTAFVDGGYEQGPRTDLAAVPEPGAWAMLVIGLALGSFGRRGWRAA